jgi:hypothetical protein
VSFIGSGLICFVLGGLLYFSNVLELKPKLELTPFYLYIVDYIIALTGMSGILVNSYDERSNNVPPDFL